MFHLTGLNSYVILKVVFFFSCHLQKRHLHCVIYINTAFTLNKWKKKTNKNNLTKKQTKPNPNQREAHACFLVHSFCSHSLPTETRSIRCPALRTCMLLGQAPHSALGCSVPPQNCPSCYSLHPHAHPDLQQAMPRGPTEPSPQQSRG